MLLVSLLLVLTAAAGAAAVVVVSLEEAVVGWDSASMDEISKKLEKLGKGGNWEN